MKLIEQTREAMRLRHLSQRTEDAYLHWIVRFLRFHVTCDTAGALIWKHPNDMSEVEIREFLTDLAARGKVSASTQNQALAALLFLFQGVLEKNVGRIDALRAQRPKRVPVVLPSDEVAALLDRMSGMHRLMAELMYGAGLRVLECCQLKA
jgi:site-specific recombinase XerD